MADTVIFDVDGTLVDSNYQHALAWYRAFRRYDIIRPLWRIHRGIGMGGDTFVPEICGPAVEEQHGDALRDAWVEEFDKLIGEVQPFEGVHELLREVKNRGFRLVLASSGKSRQVETFLDLIDGKSLADAWTTSDDAAHSKPEPDLIVTALSKVDGAVAIMVGDSPYDAIAAGKVNVPTIAVRTGGFSIEDTHRSRRHHRLQLLGRTPREPQPHPAQPACIAHRRLTRPTWGSTATVPTAPAVNSGHHASQRSPPLRLRPDQPILDRAMDGRVEPAVAARILNRPGSRRQ